MHLILAHLFAVPKRNLRVLTRVQFCRPETTTVAASAGECALGADIGNATRCDPAIRLIGIEKSGVSTGLNVGNPAEPYEAAGAEAADETAAGGQGKTGRHRLASGAVGCSSPGVLPTGFAHGSDARVAALNGDGSRISIHVIAGCNQKPLCNMKQMLLFVSMSSGKLPCLLAWERYPVFASDVVGDHTVRVR
jgi:hypothetical protein